MLLFYWAYGIRRNETEQLVFDETKQLVFDETKQSLTLGKSGHSEVFLTLFLRILCSAWSILHFE